LGTGLLGSLFFLYFFGHSLAFSCNLFHVHHFTWIQKYNKVTHVIMSVFWWAVSNFALLVSS